MKGRCCPIHQKHNNKKKNPKTNELIYKKDAKYVTCRYKKSIYTVGRMII